jgi:phosphoribosylaminoimidazole-succinocarboxamide synthase
MKGKLLYEGSVKNLWDFGSGKIEFEYTDAYSVFDWGRMPDALEAKGESLAALGAYFFKRAADPSTWRSLSGSRLLAALSGDYKTAVMEELAVLSREGLRHHFLERSHPNRLLVKRVEAIAPALRVFANHTLHHYTHGAGWDRPARLIPLEVVFRMGMPKGSSLAERLTTAYARELGLDEVPGPGARFDRPVIEFFTKLEDTDRLLSWEQAINYAGLTFEQFEKLLARTICAAAWLAEAFEEKGLELWDGKLEWALIDGELTLVDSIGPDELRLLDPASGLQLSKEFLRIHYRQTKWFEALNAAKAESAADPRLDWKALTIKRVGEPPKLPQPVRDAAVALYPSLALALTGENPGGHGLPIPALLERIRRCASR